MSSYLSSLLTTTQSRYSSLRRALLHDEADGDSEDDTNICRVLRAYYNEKGRPLPPWLPADPNERSKAAAPPFSYGTSLRTQQSNSNPPSGGYQTRAGGLGDLWDAPAQQPANPKPASLRAGRGAPPAALRPGSGASLEPPASRPLPSQRAGSYQSSFAGRQQSGDSSGSAPSSGGGVTAQDRLKARLWGGGRSSPTPSQASGRSSYDTASEGSGGRWSAQSGSDMGGGGGAGQYQAYGSSRFGGDSGGGGGYDGAGAGGSYGGSGQPGRQRMGLPSGPRQRPF